LLWLCRWSW